MELRRTVRRLRSRMPCNCDSGRCLTPGWMPRVLMAAGLYHLSFAVGAHIWPHLWFDWLEVPRPNYPLMWNAVGFGMGVLGVSMMIAARNPVGHWMIVLTAFGKCVVGAGGFIVNLVQLKIHASCWWLVLADDLVWIPPLAMILWATVRAHTGVPPTRSQPFTIDEAASGYHLSDGRTLAEASERQPLALVFLRHFGCTFTRQILRELNGIEAEARDHGAKLVLVHMLQSGREAPYLVDSGGVARIADPRCELYRAFGLGKGGFWELFGPRVFVRALIALFRGCGMGPMAGDGMQMPGAFLFHRGRIISSQPAHSASDLPDLPRLFQGLPSPVSRDKVTA